MVPAALLACCKFLFYIVFYMHALCCLLTCMLIAFVNLTVLSLSCEIVTQTDAYAISNRTKKAKIDHLYAVCSRPCSRSDIDAVDD
jgi:hypothetical protein